MIISRLFVETKMNFSECKKKFKESLKLMMRTQKGEEMSFAGKDRSDSLI